jgi:hypothetical protein
MPDQPQVAAERLLAALAELEEAVALNTARGRAIESRIQFRRERIAAGDPLPEIVENEERPLIVEMITATIEQLQRVGSGLRRAEAVALRSYGLTIERIAQLFGVTRQRVSALLRSGQR